MTGSPRTSRLSSRTTLAISSRITATLEVGVQDPGRRRAAGRGAPDPTGLDRAAIHPQPSAGFEEASRLVGFLCPSHPLQQRSRGNPGLLACSRWPAFHSTCCASVLHSSARPGNRCPSILEISVRLCPQCSTALESSALPSTCCASVLHSSARPGNRCPSIL